MACIRQKLYDQIATCLISKASEPTTGPTNSDCSERYTRIMDVNIEDEGLLPLMEQTADDRYAKMRGLRFESSESKDE